MGQHDIDEEKFEKDEIKFKQHYSNLVLERRKSLKIAATEVITDLAEHWRVSSNTSDILKHLEDPFRGTLAIHREYKRSGENSTTVDKLAQYMSDYLAYLGFDKKKRQEVFDSLSGINPRLVYRESHVNPSPKAEGLLAKTR